MNIRPFVFSLMFFMAPQTFAFNLWNSCLIRLRAVTGILGARQRRSGYEERLRSLTTIEFFRETKVFRRKIEQQRSMAELVNRLRSEDAPALPDKIQSDDFDSGLRLPDAKRDYYDYFSRGFENLLLRKKIRNRATGLEFSIILVDGDYQIIVEKPETKLSSITIPAYRRVIKVDNPLAAAYFEYNVGDGRLAKEAFLDLIFKDVDPAYCEHIRQALQARIDRTQQRLEHLYIDANVETFGVRVAAAESGEPLVITNITGTHMNKGPKLHKFELTVTSVLSSSKAHDQTFLVYYDLNVMGGHRFYEAGPASLGSLQPLQYTDASSSLSLENLIHQSRWDSTHDGL